MERIREKHLKRNAEKGTPQTVIPPKTNPFQPEVSLLVKLGSIAVHVDEMLSPGGHEFDRVAIQQLLSDADVKSWISDMHKLAMLPVKR